MNRWAGRVALVTGASSGIGAEVAKALATHGMKVVGCARNIEPIKSLDSDVKNKTGSITALKCDLTKEKDIKVMFEEIRSTSYLRGVDVIVNSAGLGIAAPLLSGKCADWKTMLDVNILGLMMCTQEAFQSMEERNVDDGHIFLISSMLGHRVLPIKESHFYSGTKFMVRALTEGIHNELREKKKHIRITAISPATVETDFFRRLYNSADRAQEIFSSMKCLEPTDIADAVVYALSTPPHVQFGSTHKCRDGILELPLQETCVLSLNTNQVHDILLRGMEQVS